MSDILLLEDVSIPENLHLLILEGTQSYQKKMLNDLNDIGFKGKITVMNSLAEAYAHFKQEMPGLILCDSSLADGIGTELLKAVRAKAQLDHLPFLMVSDESDIDFILEATSDGADGFLVKPWTKKDLIEQIAFAYSKRTK